MAINRPWGGFDVALGGFAAFPGVLAQAGVLIVAPAEC